ncbi:MAG: hypothetical protein C0501_16335 [Isosphaera sp.]|nr:hypothetical protein [Isosphaera sp.]
MPRRYALCAGLFAVSAALVAGPLSAQVPKDKDKKDDAIEKRLKAALQDAAQAEKQAAALKQDVAQLKAALNKAEAENNRLQAQLKKEKNDGDDRTIKALRDTVEGFRDAGLVHVVILKAKPDTPRGAAQDLIDDAVAQLAKIKGVRGLWAGKPAAKATPDAATDYAVALVLLFDDAAGVRAYLADPVHDRFAARHLKNWAAPVVYDFDPRRKP